LVFFTSLYIISAKDKTKHLQRQFLSIFTHVNYRIEKLNVTVTLTIG
jgi:hypothetical protein